MKFLRALRLWIAANGSQNVVYVDESGFKKEAYRPDGWAKRGEKVYGKISGNNRHAVNLIMAQRRQEWLAPMLFAGNCTQETVLAWIEQALLPELRPHSLVIMDNAPFHNKAAIRSLLASHVHHFLPLPTYSPDYNPIEQPFAILKRRRQFAPLGTSLDSLLMGLS